MMVISICLNNFCPIIVDTFVALGLVVAWPNFTAKHLQMKIAKLSLFLPGCSPRKLQILSQLAFVSLFKCLEQFHARKETSSYISV